jgi:ABC-type glycerol-3-phosphate transport system permease component
MSSGVMTVTGRGAGRENARRGARITPQQRRHVRSVGFWVVAGFVIVVFVVPYIWILASSFKSQVSIFKDVSPLSWRTFFPVDASLSNYSSAITSLGILHALLNSFIVSSAQVVGTILLCVPAAYALTRLRFRGQNIIFAMILVTFMVPGEAIVVPLYQIVTGFHLANTLPALFVPFLASPFGLFLLRQAFFEIPRELDESARIDGAGHFRILRSVILPNVRTTVASLALVTFLFSWNAFLWPLIVISSPSREVVQVAIAVNAVPGELPNWGAIFAGAVMATVPILVLFLVLQRYFVRGIVLTGMK